jgi:predicted DNA-binding protein
MEVHLTPELEAKLNEMATKTGRATDELVQDAMAGYLEELADVHGMLDRRYYEIKSGKVKPIDGEAFFESLRQREDESLQQRSPR